MNSARILQASDLRLVEEFPHTTGKGLKAIRVNTAGDINLTSKSGNSAVISVVAGTVEQIAGEWTINSSTATIHEMY